MSLFVQFWEQAPNLTQTFLGSCWTDRGANRAFHKLLEIFQKFSKSLAPFSQEIHKLNCLLKYGEIWKKDQIKHQKLLRYLRIKELLGKLPKMQKVTRNEKSCSKYTKSCQKVAEQLVGSPSFTPGHTNLTKYALLISAEICKIVTTRTQAREHLYMHEGLLRGSVPRKCWLEP